MTELALGLPPDVALSPAVAEAPAAANIAVRAGTSWRLEAVLNGGPSGKPFAFEPRVPFTLRA